MKIPSMPIDVKKLAESVVKIGQERDQRVRVELVFDPTASSKLTDMVLEAFVDVRSNAVIVDHVLSSSVPAISKRSDLCVVVGGDSMLLGDTIETAKSKGVPAIIIIARGETFFADSPADAQIYANVTMKENTISNVAGNANVPAVGTGISLDDIIDIDTSTANRPLENLGSWIVQNVPSKSLALASDFPFLRHPLTIELGKENTIQNGAISLLFFLPGADMPLITLNQAKMMIQIASVYGREINGDRIKEVAAVVLGGLGLRAIARKLITLIPVLGWLIKPAVAASGTMAMALTAAEYYEEKGKLHALEDVVDKAWTSAEPVVSKGTGIFEKAVLGTTANAEN